MGAAVSGAALFDADGNCVSGKHGASDDQLSATLTAGVYHGAILEAKPGICLLRVVVRDADSRTVAANRSVEVPAHPTTAN